MSLKFQLYRRIHPAPVIHVGVVVKPLVARRGPLRIAVLELRRDVVHHPVQLVINSFTAPEFHIIVLFECHDLALLDVKVRRGVVQQVRQSCECARVSLAVFFLLRIVRNCIDRKNIHIRQVGKTVEPHEHLFGERQRRPVAHIAQHVIEGRTPLHIAEEAPVGQLL